jgi:hypothetical protein
MGILGKGSRFKPIRVQWWRLAQGGKTDTENLKTGRFLEVSKKGA